MRSSQAVSDKKLPNVPNVTIDSFVADITTSSDYYPFGSPMDGRVFSGDKYRFGFNGQEKDDEVACAGNINTAMFWEYDTRLGRRWNVDPAFSIKPWMSPYHAFSNKPIYNIDPNGALDDGYTVSEDGFFTKVDDTGGDDYDVVYSNNKDPETGAYTPNMNEGEALCVEKGILDQTNIGKEIHKKKKEDPQYNAYEISSKEKAVEMFEFLAKNTNAEWSRLNVSRGSINLNVLSTNHKESWTAASGRYLKKDYLINEADHNHPKGNNNPSGMYEPTGDCVTAELIFKSLVSGC